MTSLAARSGKQPTHHHIWPKNLLRQTCHAPRRGPAQSHATRANSQNELSSPLPYAYNAQSSCPRGRRLWVSESYNTDLDGVLEGLVQASDPEDENYTSRLSMSKSKRRKSLQSSNRRSLVSSNNKQQTNAASRSPVQDPKAKVSNLSKPAKPKFDKSQRILAYKDWKRATEKKLPNGKVILNKNVTAGCNINQVLALDLVERTWLIRKQLDDNSIRDLASMHAKDLLKSE
jgi:hypothetical protein